MNFRKSVLLVGCVSLLVMIGLVIMLGLAIGGRAVVARSQPTPTPTKTPRPALTATSTPTPVVLAPARPRPNDTSQDASIPSKEAMPSLTDTPVSADPHVGTPAPTAPLTDTSVSSPTPTSSPASTDGPTPTPTSSPASTDGPTPTPTSSPTPTDEPTPTPTSLTPARITGRLLLDGAPVSGNLTLKLEDRSYNVVAETSVGADGVYAFNDLEPSSEGYNVSFAQEWNTQYGTDQVVSWGWLGPVAVESGAAIELPDFDVSLLGFSQVSPSPDATFSAAAISSQNPITFGWTAYPQATKYWVDLVHGEEQELVWQSIIEATSLAFDGTVDNGRHIQPGEYWWGMGARREMGSYKLTVYGYLAGLIIEP